MIKLILELKLVKRLAMLKMNRLKGIIKKNSGTTLVEVLLSIALLAIIVTPFLDTLYLSVKNNVVSKEKTEAVAISEKKIEEIKSRAIITEGSGEDNTSESSITVAYSVSSVSTIGAITAPGSTVINISTSGAIGSSGTEDNTYGVDYQKSVNNSEFELKIDQGNVDGKINSVIFEAYNINSVSRNKSSDQTVSGLLNGTESLVFNVTQTSIDTDVTTGTKTYHYEYSFGKKGALLSIGTILSTNNIANLKVSYVGGISESSKQLNLFVSTKNIAMGSFVIYAVNDEADNSGINLINYSDNELKLNYIDLPVFDPNAAVNGLFKISVTVKKNGSPIYSTTSYVKK